MRAMLIEVVELVREDSTAPGKIYAGAFVGMSTLSVFVRREVRTMLRFLTNGVTGHLTLDAAPQTYRFDTLEHEHDIERTLVLLRLQEITVLIFPGK